MIILPQKSGILLQEIVRTENATSRRNKETSCWGSYISQFIEKIPSKIKIRRKKLMIQDHRKVTSIFCLWTDVSLIYLFGCEIQLWYFKVLKTLATCIMLVTISNRNKPGFPFQISHLVYFTSITSQNRTANIIAVLF